MGAANINVMLNHIIIIINCFGPQAAKNLLFFKTEEKHHKTINTILYYLRVSTSINIDSIDPYVYERLQEI